MNLEKIRKKFILRDFVFDRNKKASLLNDLGFQLQMVGSFSSIEKKEVWFHPDLGLAYLDDNDELSLHLCFTTRLLGFTKSKKLFNNVKVIEHSGGYGFKVCMTKVELTSPSDIQNFISLPSQFLIEPKSWSYDYFDEVTIPELAKMNLLSIASSEMKHFNLKMQKCFKEKRSKSYLRSSLNNFFCSMNKLDELPMHNFHPDDKKREHLRKLGSFLIQNSNQSWEDVDKISRSNFGMPLFDCCLIMLSYINTHQRVSSENIKNVQFLKEVMSNILDNSTEKRQDFFKNGSSVQFILWRFLKNDSIDPEIVEFSLGLLKQHNPESFNSGLFNFKKLYEDIDIYSANYEALHHTIISKDELPDFERILKKFPELVCSSDSGNHLQNFIDGYKPKLGSKGNYLGLLTDFLKKFKLEVEIKNNLIQDSSKKVKIRF